MKKILIIEDEQSILKNVVEVLEFEGFNPIGAPNGIEGIRLIQEHLPALILCDIRMPQMDGYEVLQQLRQNPQTASIPFVFMTAKTSTDDIRRASEMGVENYLIKPFEVMDLLEVIQAHLDDQ